MSTIRMALSLASSCSALLAAACSSNNATPANAGNNPANDAATGGGGNGPTNSLDAASGTDAVSISSADAGGETPPMGQASLEAWLATGAYKAWTSEPMVHAQRPPSPHGFDRIYSNDIITANATGTGSWPAGAAAVKELYASATDTVPVGYAVYLKTQADSAGGANWYWYERVPLTSAAPHNDAGVVADGFGTPDSGPPFMICVSCHGAAGSDAPHTPSAGGRDQVYTPLQP